MRVLGAAVLTLLSASSGTRHNPFSFCRESGPPKGRSAWSVGPFSNGIETHGAFRSDGRWDVGLGFNRYQVDFGGADDTTLTEWTPFVRYFLFKEDDDATPVSLAVHGQYFADDFDGDDDGWYRPGRQPVVQEIDASRWLLPVSVCWLFSCWRVVLGWGRRRRACDLSDAPVRGARAVASDR